MVKLRLLEADPILHHDEPIYRNGKIVGRVTSGAFGYTLGASVGLGYVDTPHEGWAEYIADGAYEIEIAGERHRAIVSTKPFYDPGFSRPKQ